MLSLRQASQIFYLLLRRSHFTEVKGCFSSVMCQYICDKEKNTCEMKDSKHPALLFYFLSEVNTWAGGGVEVVMPKK